MGRPPGELLGCPLLEVKNNPKSGQPSNAPVANLLTIILLLAAVKMRYSKKRKGGQLINFQKGKKADKLITLRHIYIYMDG